MILHPSDDAARCIKASKDKADPCNTAFGPDSVASEQETRGWMPNVEGLGVNF